MGADRDASPAYWWSSSDDDVDLLCLILSSTVAFADWNISILTVVVKDWRLLFPRELVYIHIITSRNALTVQNAKKGKKRPVF